MVTMLDSGFEGVSSSLAEFTCFFFFQLLFSTCIMYVTETPQTTDNTRAVQGACYNHLATTLYTRALVCPHCITAAS